MADHAARSKSHLQLHDLPIPDGVNGLGLEHAPAVVSCKRLRNRLYHDYMLRLHRDILEAVTTRLFGKSFALRNDVNYRAVQEHRNAMWQPSCVAAALPNFLAFEEVGSHAPNQIAGSSHSLQPELDVLLSSPSGSVVLAPVPLESVAASSFVPLEVTTGSCPLGSPVSPPPWS